MSANSELENSRCSAQKVQHDDPDVHDVVTRVVMVPGIDSGDVTHLRLRYESNSMKSALGDEQQVSRAV